MKFFELKYTELRAYNLACHEMHKQGKVIYDANDLFHSLKYLDTVDGMGFWSNINSGNMAPFYEKYGKPYEWLDHAISMKFTRWAGVFEDNTEMIQYENGKVKKLPTGPISIHGFVFINGKPFSMPSPWNTDNVIDLFEQLYKSIYDHVSKDLNKQELSPDTTKKETILNIETDDVFEYRLPSTESLSYDQIMDKCSKHLDETIPKITTILTIMRTTAHINKALDCLYKNFTIDLEILESNPDETVDKILDWLEDNFDMNNLHTARFMMQVNPVKLAEAIQNRKAEK